MISPDPKGTDMAYPNGWQPISTLEPVEGQRVLVVNDRGMFVGTWDSEWGMNGFWMIEDGKDWERPLRGSLPTHWQSLPPPPETLT